MDQYIQTMGSTDIPFWHTSILKLHDPFSWFAIEFQCDADLNCEAAEMAALIWFCRSCCGQECFKG